VDRGKASAAHHIVSPDNPRLGFRITASSRIVEFAMGAAVSATPAKPTGACSSTRSVSGGITYDRKIATLTEGATTLS